MRSISKAIRNRKRNSWFECSESQLEIAIEEYRKETDKYAFEAENKENLELLKLSNSLKCTCKEKQGRTWWMSKAETEVDVEEWHVKALLYCDIFF